MNDFLKNNSNEGFILIGSTIALFIILSIFSIFLIRVVVKENQISNYNIADIKTRNLSQSGLDHGIQIFKNAGTPYLAPITKYFNNGEYTITFEPSIDESANPLPYSHFSMIKSSAILNDATRNTRVLVSSYPNAFNLAFFGNKNGISWHALGFDGNDQATVPDHTALRVTGPMTIEAWFRVTAHQNDWVRVVGKGASSSRNYGLWYHKDGSFLFQQYGSGGSTNINYLAPVQTNQWYHMAGVRKANGASELYINGQLQLVDDSPVTTPSTSADPVTIGFAGFHTYHKGQIDEVKIWNVARTQAEIQTNMHEKLNGNETGLVTYLHFDEGNGNIAYDQSGNGHNANKNTASWITIVDPNSESFSQSGGNINGDLYFNGSIPGSNLTGTAYSSSGSGGVQHPIPLPDFPIANSGYFTSILSAIPPAQGNTTIDDNVTILGKLVTVSNGRVYASVDPHPWINYTPSGAPNWWQIRVQFQKIDGTTSWSKYRGENTNYNTNNRARYFDWGTWNGYTQLLVKNIWIRGDFSHNYEHLRNVTIGGHNFGTKYGSGDNGTWHLEYSSGGGGESNCSGCITKTHGENKKNQTRSWSWDLGNSFSAGTKVNIKNIWIRGDVDGNSEYLDNVTIGGYNFGKIDGNCDCGTWYKGWSGNKTINKNGTNVNASAFISNEVHYTPGGTSNWWAVKAEFALSNYQDPALELTSSFNLDNDYPSGLLHGDDLSLTGINVTGSGKIFATGNITITNSNVSGGIEIASGGTITINNSNSNFLGTDVNSIAGSAVLFAKDGITINGGNFQGVIFNEGPNLSLSSTTIKGVVYTKSTTTTMNSSTIIGSFVSKYGLNMSNSYINKGSLPPLYGKSYGFNPMVIPGSYVEY